MLHYCALTAIRGGGWRVNREMIMNGIKAELRKDAKTVQVR